MLMDTIRIELSTDWKHIDEDDWHRLLARSPTRTIFQTPEYLKCWWSCFGRGQLLLVRAYDDEGLRAIAPLFVDYGMVYFIGSGGSDYLDFISRDMSTDLLRALLNRARWDASDFVGFRFYHVPAGSPTGNALSACADQLGLVCYDEGFMNAPALRYSDWPVDEKPAAQKKSLVRHERALRKLGRVEIEHFDECESIEPHLPAFFDQHVTRWSQSNFPSLFLEDAQRDFYLSLCRHLCGRGLLSFTRVALDGQPVAFHFGFQFDGTFLWYKPTYDVRYAQQSPGEVLLRALLMRAESAHLSLFDFGLGDEAFKERFATETKRVHTWGLYPASPR